MAVVVDPYGRQKASSSAPGKNSSTIYTPASTNYKVAYPALQGSNKGTGNGGKNQSPTSYGGGITSNSRSNSAGSLINNGVSSIANSVSGYGNGGNSYGYGSGSGYGSSGGGGGDYGYAQEAVAPAFDPMAALMAALEAQRAAREQAVNAANAALEKQRGVAQGRYDQSLAQLLADTQDLRNRASVQNFKAGRQQREAQADRGAFGSGLGLQERLKLSSALANNLNRINTEEGNQKMSLKNSLDNIFAQIDMQKANNLASTINNYQDQVSSLITALFANYAPSQNYYNMLSSLGGAGASGINNIVQNTAAGLNSGTGLYDTLLRYGTY